MKFILVSISALFLITGCANETTTPEQNNSDDRPNILLIVADDMGYSDIGSFGSEISTPNLDALADGGVRLSNFYAASACSPTRTMLLGGVDSHLGGMGTMYNDQTPNQLGQPGYEGYMNMDVVTVSTLLRDAGYHTYMTGKWHLGYEEDQSAAARGFDKSFTLLQGGGGHFDEAPMTVQHDTSWYREDGKRVGLPDDFFSSEFYTDRMIDYIKSGEGDGKPFFAYLAYTAPHWPLQAPDDYLDKYVGVYDDGYNVLGEKRLKAMQDLGIVQQGVKPHAPIYPESENWENLSDEQKKIDAREMELYAAMVDNMDFHIGRMIDYLEQTGQRDNTIIIFMSDNGAAGYGPGRNKAFPQEWIDATFDTSYENMGKINSYVFHGPHWAQASTAPSRLFKGFSTEGGIKVPGIVNFKGKVGDKNGTISDEFITVLDLPMTFLDLAETEHPGTSYQGRPVHPYTGKSILPFLSGEAEYVHGENEFMAWELNARPAIRKGKWKAIKLQPQFGTGEWELFDLSVDPGETNDLSAEQPEVLAELLAGWQDYVDVNGVIMPE